MPKQEYFDAGVYMIRSLITDESYIGSTVDIESRLKAHRGQIMNRSYTFGKIADAFKLHGEGDLEFRVLERCKVPYFPGRTSVFDDERSYAAVREMREREAEWIGKLNPTLNHRPRYRRIESEKLPVGPP